MDLPEKWIDLAGQRRPLDKLILDLNTSVSETYSASPAARSAVRCMSLLGGPSIH
jgi:hypothetical protein